MNRDFFDIKNVKDLIRLIVFLVVSPVIGIIMLIGMVGTSVGMICMYLKEFIMERFNEQN
tara:strand:- start:471 stop:650 length:180 start_codon:yes stop_codon:yes gene_type:complete